MTINENQNRAEEIANQLSDNFKLKSHSWPINIEALKELRLQVVDFSMDK